MTFNSCESRKNISLQWWKKDGKHKQHEEKRVSPTRPLLDIGLIFADALIIAADEPSSGNRTRKPRGLCPFGECFSTVRSPTCFFPFCSLITCTGRAGLCLYSWIHPCQGLFLGLRITECHNSRKYSKHCLLQGEINFFFESHKVCMAVVFFHLIIIQHQGHLNELDCFL